MPRATLFTVVVAGALASLAVVTAAATQEKPAVQETPAVPASDSRAFAVDWSTEVTIGENPRLAVGRDAVFVGSAETGLVAYAIADGRELWRAPLKPESPLVAFDTVVGAISGRALQFVDQTTGQPAWQAMLENENEFVRLAATSRLILAATGREVLAWRPDGAHAWRQTFEKAVVTRVLESGDALVVGLDTPEIVALDQATGRIAWRTPVPARPTSLLVSGDRIFFSASDFVLRSYRVANGLKRSWHYQLLETIGEPVADDRRVYVTFIDNTLRAFGRDGGSQRWSRPLASRPAAGPIIGREDIFVALTNGDLAQVPAATGRASAAAPSQPRSVVHLSAVAALPDATAVFAVTTAEDVRSTLSAWRVPKPAKK